jgi:hypothetical protein
MGWSIAGDANNPLRDWQILPRAACANRGGAAAVSKRKSARRECRWLRYNDSFGGGPSESQGVGPALEILE